MKKILALILALTIAMSVSTGIVFADGEEIDTACDFSLSESFTEIDVAKWEISAKEERLAPITLSQYMFLSYRADEYLQEQYYEYMLLAKAESYGLIGNVYEDDHTAQGKCGYLAVCSAVFDLEGLDIYPYWVYTGDEPEHNRAKDVAYAAKKLGLIDERTCESIFAGNRPECTVEAVSAYMVDAIIARAKRAAQDGEFEEHPEILSKYRIKKADCAIRVRNDVICAMAMVSDSQLESFKDRGFKVLILSREEAYKRQPRNGDPTYVGLYVPKDKEIFIVGDRGRSINQYRTTLHEFGHFIFIDMQRKSSELYANEGKTAFEELGEYSQTNEKEYMAEFYAHLMYHRDDKGYWEAIEKVAPETFEFVVRYIN